MALSTRWSIAGKQRNRIRAAYELAQSRLGHQQQDIRQGTTESLNARGILNGGAASAAGRSTNDRFDSEGRIGETGQANTLGGQVQRDLSTEFALERRDLWGQRQEAIATNKQMVRQDAVNAGMQAAGTIAGAYFGGVPGAMLGSTIGGAAGQHQAQMVTTMGARSSGAAGTGAVDPSMTQGPIASGGIRGAFGLNPVDGSGTPQIGVAQPGTDSFNFHL